MTEIHPDKIVITIEREDPYDFLRNVQIGMLKLMQLKDSQRHTNGTEMWYCLELLQELIPDREI